MAYDVRKPMAREWHLRVGSAEGGIWGSMSACSRLEIALELGINRRKSGTYHGQRHDYK